VFVPQTYQGKWEEETAAAVSLARDAGFIVIDLSHVYEGKDIEALQLAEWDRHPNASGHALIADKLYSGLRDNEDALGLVVLPQSHAESSKQ
jgi:hypothetical protein